MKRKILMFFGIAILFFGSFNINALGEKNIVVNIRSGFNFCYEELVDVQYLNSSKVKDYFLDKLFDNEEFLEKYCIKPECKEKYKNIFKNNVLFEISRCFYENHDHNKKIVFKNCNCTFSEDYKIKMKMWINTDCYENNLFYIDTIMFNIKQLHRSDSAYF
ncbi:MAG: hypothetical protein Q4B84_00810 [Clostridia bacterium]|nr:hypothetical protein [Clostridia bacterium]